MKALDDINLEIADKEFVAIVGPSGCGKTTCLRIVAGFERPTSGTVSVNGKPVSGPGPDRAVVFQHFALFPWKTVRAESSTSACATRTSPGDKRDELIAGALELMNLESHADAFPHQLSGGMQQRVAIARAYVLDPEVLLMDEPFGALDAQTRVVMQEELVRLARVNPRTVLFITHSVEEAVYLADRVVVMTRRPGRIKEMIDIRSDPQRGELEPVPEDRGRDGPGILHPSAHPYLAIAARGETRRPALTTSTANPAPQQPKIKPEEDP